MLKVRQVKIEVTEDNEHNRLVLLAKKMKVSKQDIISYEITKQSLDARDKNNIYYVYEFDVVLKNEDEYIRKNKSNDILIENENKYVFPKCGTEEIKDKIVIVGSGPAGLFSAYVLCENGYKPLIIERGKMVEERVKDVNLFWQEGKLQPNSNVQFGEGGAGTFSDGKLTT